MKEHLVFLTGKLAKISLEKVLSDVSSKNQFTYEIIDIGVNVAALATVNIIIKKIKIDHISKATKIIIPGRCRGEIKDLEKHFMKKCIRGPEELKDLPRFLGLQGKDLDLSKYDTKLLEKLQKLQICQ